MMLKLQIIAGVAALSAAVWAGHSWGVAAEHARATQATIGQQNAVIVAGVHREEENGLIRMDQAATNSIIKGSYAQEIAAVNGQSAGPVRLRVPSAVCGGTASRTPEAASPSRGDAPPAGAGALLAQFEAQSVGEGIELPADLATRLRRDAREADASMEEGIELPADLAARLDQDAKEADLVVASCRALQQFTTKNGLAP